MIPLMIPVRENNEVAIIYPDVWYVGGGSWNGGTPKSSSWTPDFPLTIHIGVPPFMETPKTRFPHKPIRSSTDWFAHKK